MKCKSKRKRNCGASPMSDGYCLFHRDEAPRKMSVKKFKKTHVRGRR